MSFMINWMMTQEYQGVNVGILEDALCQPPSQVADEDLHN